MTIRERILARPELDAARAARDITALAAALNAEGLQQLQQRYIGQGTVLDVMPNGGAFMDFLVQTGSQNRDVYWAIDLLKAGRFDIGTTKAQAQLDQFAQAAPEFAEGIASLKTLGYAPNMVSQEQVAMAMYNPDGSEK